MDRPPFVTPQSWNGGRLIVPLCLKAFTEEVVGQDARLWKVVASAAYFEADPAISVPSMKVVFVDEFGWYVGDIDAGVFGVFHWSVQVEVF